MTDGPRHGTERRVRRLFSDAVLAFSVDPGPDNLERYLAASKALAGLRRSRQTPAHNRAIASTQKENAR
jgi:hypothetical protein